jgi:cyclic pyranopterin phosphate synthase
MSRHLDSGALKELTLTTNGSQLAPLRRRPGRAGVRRINVSLDTLDERQVRRVTRWGRLPQVLRASTRRKRPGCGSRSTPSR